MHNMKNWTIVEVSKYYFKLVDRYRDDFINPKHPKVKRMKAYYDKQNKQMDDFYKELEKEVNHGKNT